jgi:hypothetical protein
MRWNINISHRTISSTLRNWKDTTTGLKVSLAEPHKKLTLEMQTHLQKNMSPLLQVKETHPTGTNFPPI